MAVSPDGRFWYVSIAHGAPFGAVWKYAAGSDSLVGRVRVGMFPTTIGISPDGAWAYVPNSDFHGDRGHANDVSVLYLPDMRTVVEIPTCDMPHGSRFNHAGTAVYIACMMSDELVEIDPSRLTIARRVPLGAGGASHAAHDAPAPAAPAPARPGPGAASSTLPGQNPDCLTTFVSVSPDDRLIYLACSKSHEVQVRDARTLELVGRLPAGDGTYNVEPSPDGRWVLATNKKAQSVSVFDTRTWREVARVPTSKRVPHGIAFSPDGRYAFVTRGIGGERPGRGGRHRPQDAAPGRVDRDTVPADGDRGVALARSAERGARSGVAPHSALAAPRFRVSPAPAPRGARPSPPRAPRTRR